ncbi:MAG: hypothetical protein Q9227_004170 [Pyrenula ochraceoflavens]
MASVLGKRKSSETEEHNNTVNQNDVSVTTPTSSPSTKRVKITKMQKQALIDNLQLEITERARHLRAHYSLQASDLRSRIERRINRIPISLRKSVMSDLLIKYSAPTSAKKPPPPPKSPRHSPVKTNHPLPPLPHSTSSQASSPVRYPNRNRAAEDSDKENGPLVVEPIPVHKNTKRAKGAPATTGAVSSGARPSSRSTKTTTVLSPKSHNSRNLPRASPTKEASTTSENAPSSPSKRPQSPLKHATSAIFHGIVRTASRDKINKSSNATKAMPPPPPPVPQTRPGMGDRAPSSMSSASATSSNATTVVTKAKKVAGKAATAGVAAKTTAAAAAKGKAGTATGARGTKAGIAARKGTAKEKPGPSEGQGGRRVLRKRN